jgi:hypothetical protein
MTNSTPESKVASVENRVNNNILKGCNTKKLATIKPVALAAAAM